MKISSNSPSYASFGKPGSSRRQELPPEASLALPGDSLQVAVIIINKHIGNNNGEEEELLKRE